MRISFPGVTSEAAPQRPSIPHPVVRQALAGLLDRYSAMDVANVAEALREGIEKGTTTDDICRTIRGRRSAQHRDGLILIDRRDCAVIVRTAIARVSSRRREAGIERAPRQDLSLTFFRFRALQAQLAADAAQAVQS